MKTLGMGLLFVLASACGGASVSARPTTPPPTPPAGPPVEIISTSGPPITARYTGQEQPTLLLQNNYPVMQWVFIDGQLAGTVPCGESRAFPIAPGSRRFDSADSNNIADNPASGTLNAQGGHEYRWEIFVQGHSGQPRCLR